MRMRKVGGLWNGMEWGFRFGCSRKVVCGEVGIKGYGMNMFVETQSENRDGTRRDDDDAGEGGGGGRRREK